MSDIEAVELIPNPDGSWKAFVVGHGPGNSRVTYEGPLVAAALALEAVGLATAAEVANLRRDETVLVGPWSDGGLIGSNAALTVALCSKCAAPLVAAGQAKPVRMNKYTACGSCGDTGEFYEIALATAEPGRDTRGFRPTEGCRAFFKPTGTDRATLAVAGTVVVYRRGSAADAVVDDPLWEVRNVANGLPGLAFESELEPTDA